MAMYGPHALVTPEYPTAADGPSAFQAFAASVEKALYGTALDEADRDTRYSGIPDGGLVSCPARHALWQRTADGWYTLCEDTGWITTGFIEKSGWEFNDGQVRRRNGVIDARFGVTNIGPEIKATSVGNIVDATVLQVPAGFEPSGYGAIGTFRAVYTSGAVRLTGGGNVIILDMHPGSTISTDEALRFSFTFLEG